MAHHFSRQQTNAEEPEWASARKKRKRRKKDNGQAKKRIYFRRFLKCIFYSFTFCRSSSSGGSNATTQLYTVWSLLFTVRCTYNVKRVCDSFYFSCLCVLFLRKVHGGNLFPLDFLSIFQSPHIFNSSPLHVAPLKITFRCDGYTHSVYSNQSIIAHTTIHCPGIYFVFFYCVCFVCSIQHSSNVSALMHLKCLRWLRFNLWQHRAQRINLQNMKCKKKKEMKCSFDSEFMIAIFCRIIFFFFFFVRFGRSRANWVLVCSTHTQHTAHIIKML